MKELQQIAYGNEGVIELTMNLCKDVIARNVQGDFIEAGVAYGAHAAAMSLACNGQRQVYCFDSFEGIPKYTETDIEFWQSWGESNGNPRESSGITVVPLDICQKNIARFCSLDNFHFVKGWFKDTLPTLTTESFAIIRLDCDLYDSYMDCFTYLYPRLNPGGYLIMDDWNLSGCRLAFKEYFGEEMLNKLTIIPELNNAYLVKQN
jgi:predicted O-methyltransferase YrrM